MPTRCRCSGPGVSTEASFGSTKSIGLSVPAASRAAIDEAAERERRHDAGKQHGIAGRQQDDGAFGQIELRHAAARGAARRLALPSEATEAPRPIAA